MRLKDVARVRTDFMGADFWLTRRGSLDSVGEPSRSFSPYHIGVRVEATGLILPNYLYYVFVHLHPPYTTDSAVVEFLGLKGKNGERRLRAYKAGKESPPFGVWRRLLVATGRVPQEILPVVGFMGGQQ